MNSRKVVKNKAEMIIDIVFMTGISIAFSVLIGGIAPVNSKSDKFINTFFIIWLSMMSFIFIGNFFWGHKLIYEGKRHPYLTTILTVLVFPFLVNDMIGANTSKYLRTYPEDNIATFVFDVDIEKTRDSGVGSQINKIIFVNDIRITGRGNVSNKVSVRVDEPIIVTTRITESDESVLDFAERNYKLDYYCNNKDKLHYIVSFEQDVKLREKGGRINSGASADFTAKYTVKRIVPDLKTSLSLFFYVDDELDYLWIAITALFGLGSLHTIIKTFKLRNEVERKLIEEKRRNRDIMKEH